MKVIVDQDSCIGCGACVSISDEKIFNFNDEGKAHVIKTPSNKDEEDIAIDAEETCPVDAISTKD